jgi:hypothetical protein
MPVVINLRGTGGAGKSTVVRRVMGLCKDRVPQLVPGRKQPLGYLAVREGAGPHIYVPGHYETACGGCDTIKTVDEVYRLMRDAILLGRDVLAEGIMIQDDVRRAVELDKELKAQTTNCQECRGSGFSSFASGASYSDVCGNCSGNKQFPGEGLQVILLTTPIEDCLAAIRDRRAARGDDRPLSEKNTRDRARRQEGVCTRLRNAGVVVHKLDREAAFQKCCGLLRLTT